MMPARLALITAVGPPDCATNKFPANSAIIFPRHFLEPRKRIASIPVKFERTPCQREKRLSKGNPQRKLQIPRSKHQRNPKPQSPTETREWREPGKGAAAENAHSGWALELYTSTTGFSNVPMPEIPMRT